MNPSRETLEKFKEAFINEVSGRLPAGFLCLVLDECDIPFDERSLLRDKIKALRTKLGVVVLIPPWLCCYQIESQTWLALHAAYRLGIIDQWIKDAE